MPPIEPELSWLDWRHSRHSRRCWIVVLTLLCAVTANAQSILPDDPIYGLLDRLIAARIIQPTTISQRPMSEERIRVLLDSALAHLPASDSSILARETRKARLQFVPRDSATHRLTLTRADFGTQAVSSPPRGIPTDGNGAIDVVLNPLVGNRLGLPADGRSAFWVRDAAAYRFDEHFDLTLGGSFYQRYTGDHGPTDVRLDLLDLRARFSNVAITLGRDNQFFGQGMTAGLTNSLNPRAFDLVRVQSDHPFRLPWVSRVLGPFDASAYLADLGGTQLFPHAHLVSYKLSSHPFESFELGATVADQMGGQGAPGGTFLDKVEDIFPLLDATILHRTLIFSNKFVGLDGRWVLPGNRGVQAYMEGVLDDFDLRRFKSSLTQDAGYIYGLSADCLFECGRFHAVAEYHTTGLRYYTHGILKSGYTLDHQFIGDQLGPRGQAGYLHFDLSGFQGGVPKGRIEARFGLDAAYEIRSGDAWGAVSTTSNDSDFHFVIIQHHPAERRWRSLLSVTALDQQFQQIVISGGGERVQNFDFQPGWRTNLLVQLTVTERAHGGRFGHHGKFWP